MRPSIDASTIKAMPFHQAWSLEDTRSLLDLHNTRPGSQPASSESGDRSAPDHRQTGDYQKDVQNWYNSTYWPVHVKLISAIASHILDLSTNNQLTLPPHAEAVKTQWLKQWRRLVETKSLPYVHDLINGVHKEINFEMDLVFLKDPSIDPVQFHQILQGWVQAGNLNGLYVESEECSNSGLRLSTAFNDWQPQMGVVDYAQDKMGAFIPLFLGQVKTPGIEHVVIQVPTGELLICDWFRIPEFTQATEAAKEEEEKKTGHYININNASGVLDQTRLYAELGFVSVFVGNSSPSVIHSKGGLYVGALNYDDDEEGEVLCENNENPISTAQELGSISTELWWATIIDKQTLRDLVCSQGATPEEAQAKIEEMMKDQYDRPLSIQVPPGEYHLYFSASPDIFTDTFQSPDADLTRFDEPMCILSPTPLTLEPKPKKPKMGEPINRHYHWM